MSVATAPVNTPATGLPAITGTARVGETLTASVSDNADADGLEGAEFAYRWISNDGDADTDIEDATKASYTLTAAETGKAIRVRVTFTDDGFMEETLTSEATATVEAAVAEANAGPAAGETVLWSADMEVIDYGAGSTGGTSADLFSNIGGSGGLRRTVAAALRAGSQAASVVCGHCALRHRGRGPSHGRHGAAVRIGEGPLLHLHLVGCRRRLGGRPDGGGAHCAGGVLFCGKNRTDRAVSFQIKSRANG